MAWNTWLKGLPPVEANAVVNILQEAFVRAQETLTKAKEDDRGKLEDEEQRASLSATITSAEDLLHKFNQHLGSESPLAVQSAQLVLEAMPGDKWALEKLAYLKAKVPGEMIVR